MCKRFLITCLTLLLILSGVSAKHYSLSVAGVYGYNSTWEHYGGGELKAFLPIEDNFEMEVALSGLSSNVYSASMTARPCFAVPVGELFMDGTILYSAIERNRINNYAVAVSLGYRMDYVSVQVGMFSQVWGDMDKNFHSTDGYIVDPFNLLYRLQVNVRPARSPWNVYFWGSDYTEMEFEHHWQPIFALGGYYDLPFYNVFSRSDNMRGNIRNLRLFAEVECKPTGMFHLNASFYGAKAKVGLSMRF